MKNQYFGDINDYRKYGLLRCFIDAGFRVGVCWMLTPDSPNRDGQKTGYLTKPRVWRQFDPPLFDLLSARVASANRSLHELEESSLMAGARYFSEVLRDDAFSRSKYMASMLRALSSADLLFFDPDNGLEVKSARCGSRGSSKYLYWREVEHAWRGDASLLVFQHYNREPRQALIRRLCHELASRTGDGVVVPIDTAHVLFLFCGQPAHVQRFEATVRILSDRWPGQVRVCPSRS